eukprot:jgi/Chrpa1/10622/Chrysochromulina_OHIO_Genome00019019-RA
MTTVASKTQLASWATKVCGMSIGKSLPIEKQCSNGAIYCELLEAARPGSINLQKVNKEADAEHKALPNYKLLEAALFKAGIEHPLDLPNLCKANPIAHLDLLQRIYALAPPATPGSAKGLRPFDANSANSRGAINSLDASSSKHGGSKRQMLKRSAEEMAGPLEEGAAAGSIATELAAAAPTSVVMSAEVEELRAQLEQLQGELKASRAESHSLREEADFYIRKLERIEEACVDTTQPHAEVISTVVRLLHAEA